MFTHILIPTDGSDLSLRSALAAIQLAKTLNASVTGFFAQQEYPNPPFDEYTPMSFGPPDAFRAAEKANAKKFLDVIEKHARSGGVPFQSKSSISNHPYSAIISAAREAACDLIFMASHGRRGITALLLGSETSKVLTHCTIPVLVYRESGAD